MSSDTIIGRSSIRTIDRFAGFYLTRIAPSPDITCTPSVFACAGKPRGCDNCDQGHNDSIKTLLITVRHHHRQVGADRMYVPLDGSEL